MLMGVSMPKSIHSYPGVSVERYAPIYQGNQAENAYQQKEVYRLDTKQKKINKMIKKDPMKFAQDTSALKAEISLNDEIMSNLDSMRQRLLTLYEMANAKIKILEGVKDVSELMLGEEVYKVRLENADKVRDMINNMMESMSKSIDSLNLSTQKEKALTDKLKEEMMGPEGVNYA